MKDDVVRSVLKEYIEGDMPDKKDPWPIIRAMLPEGSAEHATTPTLGRTAESMIAKPPQARIQPGARKFRVNAAMALVALVVLAGLVPWSSPEVRAGYRQSSRRAANSCRQAWYAIWCSRAVLQPMALPSAGLLPSQKSTTRSSGSRKARTTH